MDAPVKSHGGVYAGSGPAARVERAGWRQGARRSSIDAAEGQGHRQGIPRRHTWCAVACPDGRPEGARRRAAKGGVDQIWGIRYRRVWRGVASPGLYIKYLSTIPISACLLQHLHARICTKSTCELDKEQKDMLGAAAGMGRRHVEGKVHPLTQQSPFGTT